MITVPERSLQTDSEYDRKDEVMTHLPVDKEGGDPKEL